MLPPSLHSLRTRATPSSSLLRQSGARRAALRDLPDPGIASKDELAGPHRCGFEIGIVGRKKLPLRGLFAEKADRAHPRELVPQTLVVLRGGREPDAVVGGRVALLAQNEQDPVLHVHRQAAEHRPRERRKGGELVQHEPIGYGLLPPGSNDGFVERMTIARAMNFRHAVLPRSSGTIALRGRPRCG